MKHSLLSFNGIATQKNQTQKSKIVRDLYPFLLFWWVLGTRIRAQKVSDKILRLVEADYQPIANVCEKNWF